MVRLSRAERRRNERGAVAIVTAMVAMVLFIVAALVVDLGLARDARRQSQNAADSASLAAANVLYGNTVKPDFAAAVAAAKAYAAQNFGITAADWSACTDPSALRYQPAGTCLHLVPERGELRAGPLQTGHDPGPGPGP